MVEEIIRPPWKYMDKVLGMGESNNKVHFKWGVITETEKALLTKHIASLTKWKARVTEILDNPPRDLEIEIDKLRNENAEIKARLKRVEGN